jgi:hypothetical protein
MSANTMVTTFRTSEAAPVVSGRVVAHAWQKRARSEFSSPQDGQTRTDIAARYRGIAAARHLSCHDVASRSQERQNAGSGPE